MLERVPTQVNWGRSIVRPVLFGAMVLCMVCVCLESTSFGQMSNYQMIGGINDEESITVVQSDTGDLRVYVGQPEWSRCALAGMRALQIRVEPSRTGVFLSNATFRFTVTSENHVGAEIGTAFIDIPIEAGQSSATATLMDNRLTGVSRESYRGSLNGRNLNGQHGIMYSMSFRMPNQNQGGSVAIFLSKETSDRTPSRKIAWSELQTGSVFHFSSTLRNNPQAHVCISYCDVARFPTNWLTLSGLSQIAMDVEDLKKLKAADLQTLNRFVRAGGVLSVSSVRSKSEVQKLLGVNLAAALSEQELETFKSYGIANNGVSNWSNAPYDASLDKLYRPTFDPIPNSHYDQFIENKLREELEAYTYRRPGVVGVLGGTTPVYRIPRDLFEVAEQVGSFSVTATRDIADWHYGHLGSFASVFSRLDWRAPSDENDLLEKEILIEHGFGMVYLDYHQLTDQDCMVGELVYGVSSSPIPRLQNRTARYAGGMGVEFWDWIIPSVGKTPVWSFLGLILLITGVCMPAALIVSRRYSRRGLVLIYVPAIALVSTVLMISYAVVKDGFGARARIRSISIVDKNGDGVAWSRQSYFAGSVPSSGVHLSPETEVLDLGRAYNQPWTLRQTDEGQHYFGLIAPRTQCQFSVTHPIEGLEVFQRGVEPDPVIAQSIIKNSMKETWLDAVFVDEQGQIFHASEVKPDATASWVKVSSQDAKTILQRAYDREVLVAPEDAPKWQTRSLLDSFFGMHFMSPASYLYYGTKSHLLNEEFRWQRLAGNEALLAPGTYVIYCERGKAVQRLLEDTDEADGLHVIAGEW